MGNAMIDIHLSFFWSVTLFFRNFQRTFMVAYGCSKISQNVIGDAKIAIGLSFS